MFIDSPELYDAIYHFKNYARECDRLRSLINEVVPGARTILDVACGTSAHAKFLKHQYAVDGIDINESYLRAARLKNPSKRPTRRTNSRRDIFISHDFRRQYRNCDQSSDARFQEVRQR
jgi:ubiquinone/menaquinone biosynthesis C-methylase UbiE